MGRGAWEKETGSASRPIREYGWHCGNRSVLVSWLWALLPLQPQGAIMRNPPCIRFRDECIIYLGGFTTNLPLLLSKWNHDRIHASIWLFQRKARRRGGAFTDGRGSICKDLQMIQDKMFCFFGLVETVRNDSSLKKPKLSYNSPEALSYSWAKPYLPEACLKLMEEKWLFLQLRGQNYPIWLRSVITTISRVMQEWSRLPCCNLLQS